MASWPGTGPRRWRCRPRSRRRGCPPASARPRRRGRRGGGRLGRLDLLRARRRAPGRGLGVVVVTAPRRWPQDLRRRARRATAMDASCGSRLHPPVRPASSLADRSLPPVIEGVSSRVTDRTAGTFVPMVDELRRRVAVACRILAHAGLIEDVLGHVSVRVDDEAILVRARGPEEQASAVQRAGRRRRLLVAHRAARHGHRPRAAQRAAAAPGLLPRRPGDRRRRPRPPTGGRRRRPRRAATRGDGRRLQHPRRPPRRRRRHRRLRARRADRHRRVRCSDARVDGRAPRVRAARPRDHRHRRHAGAGRRPSARHRPAGPDGVPCRRRRRPAGPAAGRRPRPAPRPRRRVQRRPHLALPRAAVGRRPVSQSSDGRRPPRTSVAG